MELASIEVYFTHVIWRSEIIASFAIFRQKITNSIKIQVKIWMPLKTFWKMEHLHLTKHFKNGNTVNLKREVFNKILQTKSCPKRSYRTCWVI